MSHDILSEGAISLNAAMRLLADETGSAPSPVTGWRWCRKGIKRNGNAIRLGYVRIGRRIATSKSAVERFVEALAAADTEQPELARLQPNQPRLPPRRAKEIAKAEAVCASAKI